MLGGRGGDEHLRKSDVTLRVLFCCPKCAFRVVENFELKVTFYIFKGTVLIPLPSPAVERLK